MTTENEAFKEWFCDNYPEGTIISNPSWHTSKIYKAAKASSEQRIAELEAEVKAYQDEQVAYTMKVVVERTASAHINRLREALGVLVRTGELQMNDDRHQLYVEVSKSDIRKAKKALAPAQSLKAHDDELIERCAKECEYAATPYRDADKFYICAEAVRALKGKST